MPESAAKKMEKVCQGFEPVGEGDEKTLALKVERGKTIEVLSDELFAFVNS